MNKELKYLNLTDEEVRGILNGTCKQLIRRSKTPDAFKREQIREELDVFGPVGTTLGGREAWRCINVYPDNAQVAIEYRAGGRNFWDNIPEVGKFMGMVKDAKWQPANHQPKFSVRLQIEVTAIHVHRLFDLREEDARYIGMEPKHPTHHNFIHPGHVDPALWGYPWNDYEVKSFNGEPSARDSYFSWYRYNHGKTNFHANDWQIRAEFNIIEPSYLNSSGPFTQISS